MRLKIVFALLSEITLTELSPSNAPDTNLSAFNLGVYANQFLWSFDQAFVGGSNDFRLAALNDIQGLRSYGGDFVDTKSNSPFWVILNVAERSLPANAGPDFKESIYATLRRPRNDEDIRTDGEWYYSAHEIDTEREYLRKVIADTMLTSPQQREWFELGWLIDSGWHRPDVGNFIYQFDPRPLGRLPIDDSPQAILTNGGDSEFSLHRDRTSNAAEQPVISIFSQGELPPLPGWWVSVSHLCRKLRVPFDSEQPDLTKVSLIVDTVKHMLDRARTTISAAQSDVLKLIRLPPAPPVGTFDRYQQTESGSPIVGTARRNQEGFPLAGIGTDASNGSSTWQRGEDVATRQPVAGTGAPVTLGEAIPPAALTPPNAVVMSNESGQTQTAGEGSSSSKGGDALTPMSSPQAAELEEFGNWVIRPINVEFKDNGQLKLTGLLRAILKRLLSCEHREGWVCWKSLAEDAWEKDANPSNKAVIAGVYRLNKVSRDYAKKGNY